MHNPVLEGIWPPSHATVADLVQTVNIFEAQQYQGSLQGALHTLVHALILCHSSCMAPTAAATILAQHGLHNLHMATPNNTAPKIAVIDQRACTSSPLPLPPPAALVRCARVVSEVCCPHERQLRKSLRGPGAFPYSCRPIPKAKIKAECHQCPMLSRHKRQHHAHTPACKQAL